MSTSNQPMPISAKKTDSPEIIPPEEKAPATPVVPEGDNNLANLAAVSKTMKHANPGKKFTSTLKPYEDKEDLKPYKQNLIFKGVSDVDIAISVRHLSVMLKSGIAIDAALKILSEQSENKSLRKIFREILKNVEEGIGLAESMKKYPRVFSPTIVSIISVGEKGGSLEKNLLFLGDYLKKAHELDSKLKAALLYPIIIMSLTFVEMFGIIFFILPQLENLFSSFKNIPEYTKIIMGSSHFIRENIIVLAIVFVVLLLIVAVFLRTKAGKIFKDNLSLNFPVMKKLYKSNILATFSRTLGILLENGIPLVRALHITSETIDNSIYSALVLKIHKRVENGENLATALDDNRKYFPGTFTRMIGIGEETGTLQENLVFLYEFYAEEVDEMSNNITTLIEPILLIFIGVMIGGLALMIIGPIYQLTSSINS